MQIISVHLQRAVRQSQRYHQWHGEKKWHHESTQHVGRARALLIHDVEITDAGTGVWCGGMPMKQGGVSGFWSGAVDFLRGRPLVVGNSNRERRWMGHRPATNCHGGGAIRPQAAANGPGHQHALVPCGGKGAAKCGGAVVDGAAGMVTPPTSGGSRRFERGAPSGRSEPHGICGIG